MIVIGVIGDAVRRDASPRAVTARVYSIASAPICVHRRIIRPVLAALLAMNTAVRVAAAEPPPSLPVMEASVVAAGPTPTLAISVIAPRSWTNAQVRRAMLQQAADLAIQNNSLCFSIVKASFDRKASYIPLRSGHITIEADGGAREWRRYWRLYENVFISRGVRLGTEKAPHVGGKVTRAQMIVHLCADGEKPSGKTVDATRIIADDHASPGK